MKNTIIPAVMVLLIASVSFLFYQNLKINQRINELSKTDAVKITPVTSASHVANPPGASPFDKPNIDPLANQFPPESGKMPEPSTIKFEKLFYDFGKINEGDVVSTLFRFTNTGKNPLIITSAKGSCGCTVPNWPHYPVKPGKTDEIGVEFNSSGKKGEEDKTITVSANTSPANTTLTIRATVIPKNK